MSEKGFIQIDIAGERYETELSESYIENRNYKLPETDLLRSVIPGMIMEFKVKAGDKVKAGKPILILEAMKMLNEISLEFPVMIEEIVVKVGDIVAKDQILVRYKMI